MARFNFFFFLFFDFFFPGCKESVTLDKTKLNTIYFIGKYRTIFFGKQELIFLKQNGFYDYSLENCNLICNAGKWNFECANECYVSLSNYPNIRSKKIFSDEGDKVNISFNVNTHIEDRLGDLETMVIDDSGGELTYTLVKEDKVKNNDYVLIK